MDIYDIWIRYFQKDCRKSIYVYEVVFPKNALKSFPDFLYKKLF